MRAGERRQRGLQAVARHAAGPSWRRQLALEVVGRRRRPEADRRAVALAIGQVELHEAGRAAEEHAAARRRRTDPGCRRARRASSRPGGGRARRRRARWGRSACRRRGCRRDPAPGTSAPRPADDRADQPDRLREDRRPCLRPRGAATVAPAARACPPPPKRPVRTVASTPPGFVRTLIRVARPASLNRMATSASSAWASRSMMPSECGGLVAGRREVGVGERRPDDAPAVGALEPVQDAAEQPQLRFGLRAIQPARDVGQRRAGLDERGGDRERARRRVRMGERRGVHDDAGHQRARPARRRRGRAGRRAGAASSATISQVAAAAGSIQSASPTASFDAWWSMTTRGNRSNSSACRRGHLADAIERPAIGHDEEVVAGGRIGIGPEPLDPGDEVVERRDRIGAHRIGRAAERLDDARDAERRTDACRHRGSRG